MQATRANPLLLLAVLCAAPSTARGIDDPVAPPPAETAAALDPVVVTATRSADDPLLVPAAIDVIERDAIERAQPRVDLSETLQRIPGVVARDRQNLAQDLQISIRGFGARSTFGVRGIRLFTDGIPATMPDGQGQVSHFSLLSSGRIEVLRGPFSALYGNASGGVVELFTAQAPPEPELETGLLAGADGLQRLAASWRARWGAGEAGAPVGDVLVDVADLHSDGFRDHSAARRRTGQALLRGDFGADGRFTVLANAMDLQADDPQGLTRAQLQHDRRAASQGALLFDTRKSVGQEQLGARLEHPLGDAHALVFTTYAGNRRTAQMLSVPVPVQRNVPLHNGGAIDLDRDYRGADARWQWDAELAQRPFALTGGLQYELSDEHRLGFENFRTDAAGADQIGVVGALRRDERNRVASRDVYLQADWMPAERWRVNLGVRRSEVRFRSRDRFVTDINPDDSGALEFSSTSPVAGVLFRVTPAVSLYANAGRGFETPTGSELAYRSDGGSGLNTDLRPARSRNVEAGVRARGDRGELSAALFHSRTEDELVVTANLGGRSVYDNANVSRRRGLEFAAATALGARWHVASAYTFLDARYVEDFGTCASPPCTGDDALIAAGRHIPGLSRHFAWAELRFSPDRDSDILLEGRFVDRVFVDDANSEAAPAYASVDLAAERRIHFGGIEWRGFARIENLFDREYVGSVIVNDGNGRFYEPAPGRSWVVGLAVTARFP